MYSRSFDHSLGLSRWLKALLVFMISIGFIGLLFAFAPLHGIENEPLTSILQQPVVLAGIIVILGALITLLWLGKSSKWQIVGFQFDGKDLVLLVRNKEVSSLQKIAAPLEEYKHTNVFTSQSQKGKKGYRLELEGQPYDFLRDGHFWSEELKAKSAFKNILLKHPNVS